MGKRERNVNLSYLRNAEESTSLFMPEEKIANDLKYSISI